MLGIALVLIIGGYTFAAKAADDNSTETELIPSLNGLCEGIGLPHARHGFGRGVERGFENIEISEEYTQKVNDILNEDEDVQNLISEGYEVVSIRPVIKRIVEADGTITSKATNAIVRLENGTSGFATVNVDVELEKVNLIEIITRTIIDKTTS